MCGLRSPKRTINQEPQPRPIYAEDVSRSRAMIGDLGFLGRPVAGALVAYHPRCEMQLIFGIAEDRILSAVSALERV